MSAKKRGSDFFLPHENLKFLLYIASQSLVKKNAIRLHSESEEDIKKAAMIIKNGGIVAFPFNGIFGLFGDIDNTLAAKKIIRAKNRPKDKNLIIVTEPEEVHKLVMIERLPHNFDKLIGLLKEVHALGIILPASGNVPSHLVSRGEEVDSMLAIWTEYPPLRELIKHFKSLGGRALVGTSANKSGQPTHHEFNSLWYEFKHDVDAIVEADFKDMDFKRKVSTTVIDLTQASPQLKRLGNVDMSELDEAIKRHGFSPLEKSNFKDVSFKGN